jgi:hypothetical protein
MRNVGPERDRSPSGERERGIDSQDRVGRHVPGQRALAGAKNTCGNSWFR